MLHWTLLLAIIFAIKVVSLSHPVTPLSTLDKQLGSFLMTRLILFTKSIGLGPNPSSSRPIDSLNREPFGYVPSYWKKH